MIKHTSDDGSSRKKNELTDVRIRSIKRIKPRKKTPRFGEPEVIEEFFYDFKLKKKVLVLRTENSFNSKGLVEEKSTTEAYLISSQSQILLATS